MNKIGREREAAGTGAENRSLSLRTVTCFHKLMAPALRNALFCPVKC